MSEENPNIEIADERLKKLLAHMCLKDSYWGYLFGMVKRKPEKNFGSIMGVTPTRDGAIHLLYEPDMVVGTNDEILKNILEHEGMHILSKHLSRMLKGLSNLEVSYQKDSVEWKFYMSILNQAADCSVNTMINIPEVIVVNGKDYPLCFPKNYKGNDGKPLPDKMSMEWYYNHMNNDEMKEKLKQIKEGIKEAIEWLKEQIEKQQNSPTGDHSNWSKELGDIPNKNNIGRQLDSFTYEIVKEAYKPFKQLSEKGRGVLDAGLVEMIEEFLAPPKVPYYNIIRKLVKGSKKTKYKTSFGKLNKKRSYTFLIGERGIPKISPFPGKAKDKTFKIVILIDTSGSMSEEEIREALSGCKDIIEKDRYVTLTVIENDTSIKKEYVIERISDIQFDIAGRGGTILAPGLKRARELKADITLGFTDGGTENINELPKDEIPKKIIWVIQQGGTSHLLDKTGFVINI